MPTHKTSGYAVTGKPKKTNRGNSTKDGHLRMKDLVQSTGVPKSTILFYIREGLLSEPIRPTKTSALYPSSCVERIKYIKQAQQRHRLPLAVIRKLLEKMDQGLDLTPLVALHEVIFGKANNGELDKAAFCKATGLTKRQVDQLVRDGLLLPLDDKTFNPDDVLIGTMIHRGLARGMDPEDLLFYPRLADEIVDGEMAIREKLTKDLPYETDANLTIELTKTARGMRHYYIDRLFQRRVMAFTTLKKGPPTQEPKKPAIVKGKQKKRKKQ
jgi:DNA-binding transcriptional MerR regulator